MKELLTHKNKRARRGFVSLVVILFIISIILLILFAFIIPLLTQFTAHLYTSGQKMMNATVNMSGIDPALREKISEASNSTRTQIIVLSSAYKYSYVVILGVIALILFMVSRMTIETRQIG